MQQVKINNTLTWLLIIAIILFLQYLMLQHPYLAITETWRQGDVASVARNFVTESMNIFYPRVDVRGNMTGISGMEFPLYNYVVALIYKISGIIWIGFAKLFSVLCSWLAVYFLYRFSQQDPNIRQRINPKLFLLISFSIPFLVLFSTLVMPEMFALALGSAALYYFSRYTQARSSLRYLMLASVLFSLCMLVRPYYAFFGFVMVADCLTQLRRSLKNSLIVAALGILCLCPFVAWYHFWVPYLNQRYGMGFYFYMGTPFADNLHNLSASLSILVKQVSRQFFVYIYLVFFALAIYWRLKIQKTSFFESLNQPFFQTIYIAILACVVLTFLVGTQYDHFYYLGAIFPAVIVATSFGMSEYWLRTRKNHPALILAVFLVIFLATYALSFIRAVHLYRIDHDLLLLEKQKNSLLIGVPKTALLVIDATPDRSYIYTLDRKGWMLQLSDNPDERKQQLEKLKAEGAQYLITAPQWQGDKQTLYTIQKIE